ncbi:MAG: hypothetical protein JWR19_3738 [Pedosphaera sp.]|nr:hypothetical protein [Pedosphaera sp.]
MAERDSEGGGSSPLNLNSLLALLTLAGGIWLVSHNLASNRPVTPAGGTRSFVGEQTLEARLWEDPFKSADQHAGNNSEVQTQANLNILIEQIHERRESTNDILLLPVMLSGGQYSEDQESRIRSRFAIVSALGQSGFAPEDAEHIGALKIQWPTQHEVGRVKQRTNTVEGTDNTLWKQMVAGTNGSFYMDLRYEWYQPRTFFPHTGSSQPKVLVIWLDDSFFEEDPLLCLPLLLESLIDKDDGTRVSMMGPRRSATLRAMLPGPLSRVESMSVIPNQGLELLASNVLQHIDLYCATPSAMDEVLVTNCDDIPRKSVKAEIERNGFKSFHNFAATDAQLAREIFNELSLGDVDMIDTNNHVVLISEWDTFYGRTLSLTYAAELALRQTSPTNKTRRSDFVQGYIQGKIPMPTNFHSFVYLRGLDGQTVGENSATGSHTAGNKDGAKERPTSIEELRNWVPDANKAEGQAQFDYLARLGGQLADLELQLQREDRGHIKAVGIVGSDVYDTLLILQALRPQFPEAVFFTTDLDARFCHPRERDWTRDLLVASGYGLTLHPDLQQGVAPFRDSAQTAQFAAALAALGNTNLNELVAVSPRRFEIGNHMAVDLSVSNALLAMASHPTDPTHGPWLHPLTLSETYKAHPDYAQSHLRLGLFSAFVLVAAICWFWIPLRRLTMSGWNFCGEALDYSEEDVGGPEGAEALLKQLRASSEPICQWMLEQLPPPFRTPWPAPPPSSGSPESPSLQPVGPAEAYYKFLLEKEQSAKQTTAQQETRYTEEKHLEAQAAALVVLLNRMLKHEDFPPQSIAAAIHFARQRCSQMPRWLYGGTTRRLRERFDQRRLLDKLLKKLTSVSTPVAALNTAAAARKAAVEIFGLRCRRLVCFWITAIGFGALAFGLGNAMWHDTFNRPDGEPFSLKNGVSAWPAQVLRFFVFASAVCFSFGLYYRMREAFFALTRKFRLSLPRLPAKTPLARAEIFSQLFFFFLHAKTPQSSDHICASKLWSVYRENGHFSRRMLRIALPLLLYIGLFVVLFDQPFDAVRGPTALRWNRALVSCAGIGFLVLALFTVDAVLLCRQFILKLNLESTDYPEATRHHFSRQWGNLSAEYLNGWIGLQLIAELTERVGRLVYYPALLLFVLMLARNGWWDRWAWPPPLILIFISNLVLALASVAILQQTAKEAKRKTEESLAAKLKQLQARIAADAEQNDAAQAERLLEEIRQLQRGAFALFWKNPVVTTVFVSSGGMTALQVLIWFMGR